ncbi:MAG: Asp-tRNA(Asn)/Glu-tRNA(Gln) amidotransferase subunit GatC [Deltaproteobacteria bacterium]|nr:Asp-tRNA(Asn)/Glu-tRNA(Gln) amidotransferase subunit GatC [Deltaproteobacteria bacterium]
MAITKRDVEHAAKLARLALSQEETELYASQMAKILTHVEKLGALDTKGIEPTSYTISPKTIFRKDEAKPSLPQDEILSNAPEKAKGCFKVPRIIE